MITLTDLWLSSSSIFMKGDKANLKVGFWFNVQKQLLPDSSHGPLEKSTTWKLELRIIMKAGSHLVVYLMVSLILGSHGGSHS